MKKAISTRSAPVAELPKCRTGIRGLDQITHGGLPRGRPTLVCGGAGSGKILFGMEFLVRGALEHGEPGVFVSFEERPVDRSEIMETGECNLDGLFIRLGAAIHEVQAKRVVLDTIEVLFGALSNLGILRSELRRLFAWLKDAVTRTIPIVMLTSSTQQEDIDRCYALGVNSYVSKPVKFEAFADTVSRLGMYWLLVNTPPAIAD